MSWTKPSRKRPIRCTFLNGQVSELSYLHARDVTYATFTQGLYQEAAAYRRFLAYQMPWNSAQESAGILLAGRWFGMLVCYLRDDDRVFETCWALAAAGSVQQGEQPGHGLVRVHAGIGGPAAEQLALQAPACGGSAGAPRQISMVMPPVWRRDLPGPVALGRAGQNVLLAKDCAHVSMSAASLPRWRLSSCCIRRRLVSPIGSARAFWQEGDEDEQAGDRASCAGIGCRAADCGSTHHGV